MTGTSSAPFLRTDEQLLRIHYFRFFTAQGCALGSVDIVVEEALAPSTPAAERCIARPQHPRLVPKSEYTVRAETVETALARLVDRLRGRPLTEAFFPTQ